MPISFKCTGCRCRLHVPTRWGGTTVACPRCQTRVVVPDPGHSDAKSTRFERTDMERSLAALQRPRPGGLSDPTFELPGSAEGLESEELEALIEGRPGIQIGPLAALVVGGLVIAALLAAFGLGVWWATPRPT